MATCTPQALPRESTCFHCIPPDAKHVLKLYLLNTLAGNLTARQLSVGAAPFRPIYGHLALAAKVYLLARINGLVITPAALEAAAACYQCIPNSARLDVETYLIAGDAGLVDTAAMTRQIGPYKSLFQIRDQVELYLLNVLAGSLSVATIVAGSKCLTCLSTGRLEEIYIRLLCLGVNPNLIPSGSVYTGSPAEFDLAVLAATVYLITWGTAELYVNICGTLYYSSGPGTQIAVATGACTLMRFFGTFAGTTVTAIVKPVTTVIPVPTGFTWTIVGANAVATWNPDPAVVFSVELWTSTDNITFSLAATTITPGTTASVAAPVSGTLYAKIRATAKVFPGYSVFTGVLSVTPSAPHDPVVDNWSFRVQLNGGAVPSNSTLNALDTFVTTLKGAGVWTKIICCNIVAPDSLIAVITPFVVGSPANDPWTNHNFVLADLSVNGLVGNGSTKWLDTGLIGDTAGMTGPSSGLVVYVSADDATTQQAEIGVYNAGGTNAFTGIYTHYNAVLNFGGMFRTDVDGFVTWAVPGTPAGFYSLQRTATTVCNIYFANSVTAHASLGATGVGTNVGAPPHNFSIAAWAVGDGAGGAQDFTKKRLSFLAVTNGLSAAEDLTLYNAVQAYRTTLGGGFV